MTAETIPVTGGAPDAIAIPSERGSDTSETCIPASRSYRQCFSPRRPFSGFSIVVATGTARVIGSIYGSPVSLFPGMARIRPSRYRLPSPPARRHSGRPAGNKKAEPVLRSGGRPDRFLFPETLFVSLFYAEKRCSLKVD